MSIVRFDVSIELIQQALAIPNDVRIIKIIEATPFRPGVYTFYVEGDQFPERMEGEMVREVMPMISIINADRLPKDFYLFNWNLERDKK